MRIRAADARCTRLDRVAHALEPAHVAAGVVGLRSAAAELVEAPASLRTLIIVALGEHASIEERTAVARIVDAVAVELLRTALAIERRHRAKESDVHDDARHDLWNRRAARNVDDRRLAREVRDARGTRRVRVGSLDTARDGAGAVSDDSSSILCSALQRVRERMTAAHAVDAVVLRAGSAFDGQDVLALVLLDRLFEMCLERLAAGSGKQMIVFERNLAQDDVRSVRRTGTDEGLIAARAFVSVNPDDDWKRLLLGSLDDLAELIRTQAHQRRQCNTALDKAAAAHAFSEIYIPHTLPFVHFVTSSCNPCGSFATPLAMAARFHCRQKADALLWLLILLYAE